jgi:hypothetical protein
MTPVEPSRAENAKARRFVQKQASAGAAPARGQRRSSSWFDS